MQRYGRYLLIVKELVKRLEVPERQALEDLGLTFSVYWELKLLALKQKVLGFCSCRGLSRS